MAFPAIVCGLDVKWCKTKGLKMTESNEALNDDVRNEVNQSMLLGVAMQLAQGWYSSPQSAGGKRMPTAQIVDDARRLCDECCVLVVKELTDSIAAAEEAVANADASESSKSNTGDSHSGGAPGAGNPKPPE